MTHFKRLASSVLCALNALLFLHATQVNAAWLPNGTPICTESHEQYAPAIAPDGASGAVIVWADGRFANTDIYAQRIDSSGVVRWSTNGVPVCTASGNQSNPVAAYGFDGGAVVFWQDDRSATSGTDIYGQRIDGLGNAQWALNGIALTTAIHDETNPLVIPDGSSGVSAPPGYIVAWRQDLDDPLEGYDIAVQHVDVNGGALWTTAAVGGVTVASHARNASVPTMASDFSGPAFGAKGAILTWHALRSPGNTGSDIFARRVDSGGALQWNPVVCGLTGDQRNPVIVNVGGGSTIIAWEDARTPDQDLYAQKISSAGTLLWPVNGMPLCRATGSQQDIVMVGDGAGGVIAAWRDLRSMPWILYAQRLDTNGQPLWTLDGIPLAPSTGTQTAPAIMSDAEGGAIIAWSDIRSGVYNIYAQRVDPNGNRLWSLEGVSMSASPGVQTGPSIATDSKHGALVTWVDRRSVNSDIYASRASAIGGNVDVSPATLRGPRLSLTSSNPAHGRVRLFLELAEPADVSLKVIDVLGRLVRVIDASAERGAGSHLFTWDGSNESGGEVEPGIYFVVVNAGRSTLSKRVALLR